MYYKFSFFERNLLDIQVLIECTDAFARFCALTYLDFSFFFTRYLGADDFVCIENTDALFPFSMHTMLFKLVLDS